MRLVGVLDLCGGRAVHARGGIRQRYDPVKIVAGVPIPPGDPMALARVYLDRLGLTALYAADLDAIGGDAPQQEAVAALAGLGAPLAVDAGVSTVERATQLVAAGASHVVIGLETLPSWRALEAICDACGGHRIIFSLDLRDAHPVVAAGAIPSGDPPEVYAVRAAEAGAATVIVLDLARVGAGVGPDLDTMAAIRQTVPQQTLLAGGGIRDAADLQRLADAGVDGALVATALHTGRIGAADVAAAVRLPVHSSAVR